MTPRPVLGACVLAAAAGVALLVTNALTVRAGRPMAEVLPLTYRYWEDVRAAAASVRGSGEAAPVPASGDAFTHAVVAESERRGIGIVSFWRSIPLDALPDQEAEIRATMRAKTASYTCEAPLAFTQARSVC